MPQRGLAFTLPAASVFSPRLSINLPRYSVDVGPNFCRCPSPLIKRGIRAFYTRGDFTGDFSAGFVRRLEIDEREALSWGSSLLMIFHLGEKGDLRRRRKWKRRRKLLHQICFFSPIFCFPLSFDGCIFSSIYVLVSFLRV